MCMFCRPVSEVASTRISARHHDSGEQTLVYSMNVGVLTFTELPESSTLAIQAALGALFPETWSRLEV